MGILRSGEGGKGRWGKEWFGWLVRPRENGVRGMNDVETRALRKWEMGLFDVRKVMSLSAVIQPLLPHR